MWGSKSECKKCGRRIAIDSSDQTEKRIKIKIFCECPEATIVMRLSDKGGDSLNKDFLSDNWPEDFTWFIKQMVGKN